MNDAPTTPLKPGRRLPVPTLSFLLTLVILVLGLVPLPEGSTIRWMRETAKRVDLNRLDRKGAEGGYYEGLIRIEGDGHRDLLAQRLLGAPDHRASFHDIGATLYLKNDILIYELRPSIEREVFGHPFITNDQGLRDRTYSTEKPRDTVRIAIMGASIDMGWGIDASDTYENRLEDWLNAQAESRGIERRYEVLNFSMAAYSPVQRLEMLRRRALAFRPDVVLFTRTLLDAKLMEIHLQSLLDEHIDPVSAGHPYLAEPIASATRIGGKHAMREVLATQFEPIVDEVMRALASDCRQAGVPVYCVIVPRGGELDTPATRLAPVARIRESAQKQGLVLIDLSDAFDEEDPLAVSVSPWDDHPNAHGHELLFQELARWMQEEPTLAACLFGPADDDRQLAREAQADETRRQE